MKTYIALFEYEEGKKGFGVVFPDLPGCFSAGDDFEDAMRMAHEALSLYADSGEPLPNPRTLEQIKKNGAIGTTGKSITPFTSGR
jgi:predicted RNase H-like HicB family nuclease